MEEENKTLMTEFILAGFQNLHTFRIPVFFLCLCIFMMTFSGNFIIIILVSISHQLHAPMYLFLCHLSLTDILVSSCVIPTLLCTILMGGTKISLPGCIIQLFIFGVSESVESLILAVMSCDRYLAICNPLRYTTIMDKRLQYHLAFWSWFLGVIIALFIDVQIYLLHFSGIVIIDHIYCDTIPLLELSCSNTYVVKLENLTIASFIILLSLTCIILSYVKIFQTIVRSPTRTGRHKAFSTCSSHLLVVVTFYSSLIAVYGVPSSGNMIRPSKGLSLIFTLGTPLFNPLVYSWKSREIRAAWKQRLTRWEIFEI